MKKKSKTIKDLKPIEISNCRKAIINEIDEYRNKIADLTRQLKVLQIICPHSWSTSYYGDPGGGSDHWTECDECKGDVSSKNIKDITRYCYDNGISINPKNTQRIINKINKQLGIKS